MVWKRTKHSVLPQIFSLALLAGMGIGTVAHGERVLFIADTGDANDAAGNQSVVDRLEFLGHSVEVVDDDNGMDPDPLGQDLVVISSSSLSGNIGNHFTRAVTPIVQWEQALWDDLEISNGGRGVGGSTSIDVVDVSHELAAEMGLTSLGTVQIRDTSVEFHVGNQANLAPGATVIAEEAGGGAPAIAVVDPGGELRDGSSAAGIRVMLFYGDPSLDGVNQLGLDIFDSAICYALESCGPPRVPGDVNGDGVADIQDFEIILANFFQSVTRGEEGDLTRDGVVDFSDFHEWKDNRTAGIGASASVPEPSCLLIAILAATGLCSLHRCRRRS